MLPEIVPNLPVAIVACLKQGPSLSRIQTFFGEEILFKEGAIAFLAVIADVFDMFENFLTALASGAGRFRGRADRGTVPRLSRIHEDANGGVIHVVLDDDAHAKRPRLGSGA